jgi:hypothetical protein
VIFVKPLDEFGGWLRFFLIVTWIGVVMCVIALPIFAFTLFDADPKTRWEAGVALFDAAATLWISRMIIKRVKDREPGVPAEMRLLMIVSMTLGAAVLLGDVLIYWAHGAWPPSGEDYISLRADSKSIQWGLLWFLYFKFSRRVKTYYGEESKETKSLTPST